MPLSFREFLSTGQATYPVGFNYISPDHVQVLVDGIVRVGGYTLANGNLTFSGQIPESGVELRIYRTTPGRTEPTKNTLIVDFVNGSTLSETDLDNAVKQNFYLVQEAQDTAEGSLLSPRSVTEPMLADNAVSTRTIQPGAVAEAKLAPNSVTTDKIANLNVTTGKVADSGITEPKLADDAVSTRTLITGSVTEGKIEAAFRGTLAYRTQDNTFTANNQFNNSPVVPLVPTQAAHATSKQYVDTGDSGYQGSDPAETNLPIGSVVIARYWPPDVSSFLSVLMPNATVKVWRHPYMTQPPNNTTWSEITDTYVVSASTDSTVPQHFIGGTTNYVILSGTWKSRGFVNLATGAGIFFLVQRIA